jgi:hypothetical protein
MQGKAMSNKQTENSTSVKEESNHKDFTSFDALLELDAFLLGDEAEEVPFSESSLAASLYGIDPDTFLLATSVDAKEVEQRGEGLHGRPPSLPTPFDGLISQDDWADAGDHEGPPHSSSQPSPLQTSASTDKESHSIADFEEEHALESLLIAPSSASENVAI